MKMTAHFETAYALCLLRQSLYALQLENPDLRPAASFFLTIVTTFAATLLGPHISISPHFFRIFQLEYPLNTNPHEALDKIFKEERV